MYISGLPGGLSMNIADFIVAGIDTKIENRRQMEGSVNCLFGSEYSGST